jgi:hypothetical protein
MNIFKNWISFKSQTNDYTFHDLALTKINDIVTQIIFDQQSKITRNSSIGDSLNITDRFIHDLSVETLSKAEQIAQSYSQQVNYEKQKLLNNRHTFKKSPTVDEVIMAIENRQNNMVQRAKYNTEQKIQIIFRKTLTKP